MNWISKEPISAAHIIKNNDHPDCGGMVSFEGVVRNHHQGKSVTALSYEAYEPMAIKELSNLTSEVESEWPMCHVCVTHRLGDLVIGDNAVAIVVWAPHRAEAFEACRAMIDRLKKRVPIWKKETYTDGKTEWVICQHQGH